jgi:TolB-like protein
MLGILIGLGVLFAWRHNQGRAEASGTRIVAVLPFENLGDSADAYFADGITDEVRGKLSQVPALAVIARASSNEYRHSTKSPQQIARELGAEYLLTATVRWEKTPGGLSRVRVSPELVQIDPGAAPTTKWQQGFDASLTDVFQVQADIATKVASALNTALGDSVKRELAAKPTETSRRTTPISKARPPPRAWPRRTRRACAVLPGFYQQAVVLDSGFVLAWSQLARVYALLYYNSTPTPQMAAQAREAANRAHSLARTAPRDSWRWATTIAMSRWTTLRHSRRAEAGLKLAPNNVDLLVTAALAEQGLGDWDAARQHLAKAAALDPRSTNTARRTAVTLLRLRRYPEARAAVDRGLALAPPTSTSSR